MSRSNDHIVDFAPPPPGESARVRARVGTLIGGKWRIESVLGVGGMAAVYFAIHEHNQRRVAIKVLHQEYCHLDDIRGRFAQEARAANRVHHRDAVPVLDDGTLDDGTPYMVMDFLEGQSLQQRFEKAGGRLPVAEAFSIAERLLEILEAAHAASVLHRDVKPDNVFLTIEGDVKLLDFGISKMMGVDQSHKTQVGAMMGTPSFMSPEQARGRWDDLDPRADLFAVGATLFAVLAGRPIHQAETLNELLLKLMTEPAPDLHEVAPHVPEFAARVVNRALAFDKQQRFSSAFEMRRAVREVNQQFNRTLPSLSIDASLLAARGSSPAISGDLTHRPVTISEWPPPSLRNQLGRRRRQLVFAALGLLLALGTFLGYSTFRGAEEDDRSPVTAETVSPRGGVAASSATDPSELKPIDLSDLPEVGPKHGTAPKPASPASAPRRAPAPVPSAAPEEAPQPDDPLARRR